MSAMGRPEIEIDMAQLAALCRMKPTMADCAAFFKCSEDTIERRIKDEAGLTFAEFREQNMAQTRFSLVRMAIQKATQGDNTMLIFCLKNMCGWSDKQIGESPDMQVNIQNNLNGSRQVFKIDLEERLQQLKDSKNKANLAHEKNNEPKIIKLGGE